MHNLASALFNMSRNSSRLLPAQHIFLSSQKSMNFISVDTLQISLRKKTNNLGPKIDPCGTPHITSNNSETYTSILTNYFLFVR